MVKLKWIPAALILSSCAIGEPSPRLSVLVAPDSGTACPDPRTIMTSPDEAQAQSALNCWRESLTSIWSQVRGARPGRFTDQEVLVLLRSGLIQLPGSPDEWFERFLGAKDLLGVVSDVDQAQVTRALDWVGKHHRPLRKIHGVWFGSKAMGTPHLLALVLEVGGTFVGLRGPSAFMDLPDAAWVRAIQRTFQLHEPSQIRQIQASVRLGRESLETLCEGKGLPACLESWSQAIAQSADAVEDYVLNPHGTYSESDRQLLSLQVVEFVNRAAGLLPSRSSGISLATLDEFVDAVARFPRPRDVPTFTDSQAWISAWSGSDSRIHLNPVLSTLRSYLSLWDTETTRKCLDCPVPSSRQSEVIQLLRNRQFGEGLRESSPRENRAILLVHALTQSLVVPFDKNRDGLLTSDQGETASLVTGLVNAYVTFQDSWSRIRGVPWESPVPPKWKRDGMGNLLALIGADVAPRLDANLSAARRFVFDFYHDAHPGGLILDRIGMSATFGWLLDLVIADRNVTIDFPRSRLACLTIGACGRLDSALSKIGPLVGVLLLATVESTFDACDANSSGVIEVTEWSEAGDEGGCLVKKIRPMILSLLDSEILSGEQSIRDLLSNLDTNVFKTMGAKVAMARGSKKDLVGHVLFPPSDKRIRLGTILDLAAEIVRGD